MSATAPGAGPYEAVFHVADWYRKQNVPLPAVPFLDVVTYRFGIADPDAALPPAVQVHALGLLLLPGRRLRQKTWSSLIRFWKPTSSTG